MPIVLEAPQKSHRPFATAAAGKEYFASEAHYRILAGQIRDELQEDGGCILLTGNPVPNGDLLLRQLAVVGPPRCRATVIRCNVQMTITGLLDNYRRLVGGTIEAVTRRVASWPGPATPAARGQEIDILILEQAENLADEVLQHLCRPAKDTHVHWPPRLLVADESLIKRFTAPSLEAASATLTGRFNLNRLAHREVGSFIRYQLMTADLGGLELFKPQVVELIEMYADGDPVIVNGLARRILRIAPSLTKLFRVPELAKQTERANDQCAPSDAALAPPEEPPSAPVPLAGHADLEQPPAPSPFPEGTAAAVELSPVPVSKLDALTPDEPPRIDASSAILEPYAPAPIVEAEVDAPIVDGKAPQPIVEANVMAPIVEAKVDAPLVEPTVPAPIVEAKVEAPLVEPDVPAPLIETKVDAPILESREAVASAPEPSTVAAAAPASEAPLVREANRTVKPPAVEPPIMPAAESVPSAIEESLPTEIAPPQEKPSATEIPRIETAPANDEIVALSPVLSFDADTVPAAAANDDDRPAATALRQKILRGVAAFTLAAASVIVAFTGTIVVTESHGDQGSYLDDALEFAKSNVTKFAQRIMPAEAPSRTVEASAPVPKDLGGQRLRTTSDANQNLLTSAGPTGGVRETISTPAKEPVVTNSASSRSAPSSASAPVQMKVVDAPPAPTPAPKLVLAAPAVSPPPAQPSAIESVPPSVVAPVAPSLVAPVAPSTATSVSPPKPEVSASARPVELRGSTSSRALASADIDQLLRRGDQLLASGDIIAARHYFELVTEAGDMRAALRLGKTYDPAFLQQNGVRGIVGDFAMAKSWYLKAIAAGDKDADMRLLQLMTLYPN